MSATQLDAFNAESPGELTGPRLEKSGPALWSAEKSALIDEYIHLFLLVTKHGVYVDLFAGPQRVEDTESWSVRRVLERRTQGNPSIRHFAVCDKDPGQAQRLRELGSRHPSFRVYPGDVNEEIHTILEGAAIGTKTACFCLIDQRTFECHWATVEAVARHKAEGRKIELFYFLAQGWLDRAQSRASEEKLRAWWGNGDYGQFLGLRSYERANALCRRFRDESSGYEKSVAAHRRAVAEADRAVRTLSNAVREAAGSRPQVGGRA